MQLSTIPVKIGQLSDIKSKNPKIRQFFILADGERSFEQIFSSCGMSSKEGLKLMTVMVKRGLLRVDPGSFADDSDLDVREVEESGSESLPLETSVFVEEVTVELAKYVGPVAKLIIEDFTFPEKRIGIDARKVVFEKLAEEFDSKEELQQFMETAKTKQWL